MNLSAVLGRVPALLAACVGDKRLDHLTSSTREWHSAWMENHSAQSRSVRNLRLIDKDASSVAAKGLRSFSLTLLGLATDANVNGATLLQQACLKELKVHLRLTGAWLGWKLTVDLCCCRASESNSQMFRFELSDGSRMS